jgi:serine/threonine protein kinase
MNGEWALRERKNSRGEVVVVRLFRLISPPVQSLLVSHRYSTLVLVVGLQVRPRSLRDILGVETSGPMGRRRDEKTGHSLTDYLRFEDLIRHMLDWSADTRMTPADALAHPFFKSTQVQPSSFTTHTHTHTHTCCCSSFCF